MTTQLEALSEVQHYLRKASRASARSREHLARAEAMLKQLEQPEQAEEEQTEEVADKGSQERLEEPKTQRVAYGMETLVRQCYGRGFLCPKTCVTLLPKNRKRIAAASTFLVASGRVREVKVSHDDLDSLNLAPRGRPPVLLIPGYVNPVRFLEEVQRGKFRRASEDDFREILPADLELL